MGATCLHLKHLHKKKSENKKIKKWICCGHRNHNRVISASTGSTIWQTGRRFTLEKKNKGAAHRQTSQIIKLLNYLLPLWGYPEPPDQIALLFRHLQLKHVCQWDVGVGHALFSRKWEARGGAPLNLTRTKAVLAVESRLSLVHFSEQRAMAPPPQSMENPTAGIH